MFEKIIVGYDGTERAADALAFARDAAPTSSASGRRIVAGWAGCSREASAEQC